VCSETFTTFTIIKTYSVNRSNFLHLPFVFTRLQSQYFSKALFLFPVTKSMSSFPRGDATQMYALCGSKYLWCLQPVQIVGVVFLRMLSFRLRPKKIILAFLAQPGNLILSYREFISELFRVNHLPTGGAFPFLYFLYIFLETHFFHYVFVHSNLSVVYRLLHVGENICHRL